MIAALVDLIVQIETNLLFVLIALRATSGTLGLEGVNTIEPTEELFD